MDLYQLLKQINLTDTHVRINVPVVTITIKLRFLGHSPVLHCASLLHIISRVISVHTLQNGGFFFMAGPHHRGKWSFSRK